MTALAHARVTLELGPQQHIERIRRVLGTPARRALVHPSPARSVRSHWQCGCTLDVIEDGGKAFTWHCCVEHSDVAGGASLVAQATH